LKQSARDLRADSTDAERKLWSRLRNRRAGGFKFRRQFPIQGYIIDFFCVEAKLAVELDGGQHTDPDAVEYDRIRDEALQAVGVCVLRFSDVDALRETDAVIDAIYRALTDGPSPPPSPGIPGEGEKRAHDLLFVYGTLVPGLEPAPMSDIVRQMTRVGPATIRGRLYDLGPYPGVLLDDGDALVKGKLVRVPPDCWQRLDRYEACPLPDSSDGLFRRIRTTATRDVGQPVVCWVYVYNRDVTRATLVEGGCWLTHRGLTKIIPS
jgi:very-short-patch-repair endonuclease/gamma-glutamylcyclotransferase (GGCT)/AIG2-like uncharacterized protein YtfP